MAAKEFTSCVKPANYVNLGFTPVGFAQLAAMLLLFGVMGAFAIILLGGNVAIMIAITVLTAGITFLNWWLYGRLICLGGKQCVIIGVVQSFHLPNPLKKGGDNDATVNILLAPGPVQLGLDKTAYWSPPEGPAQNAPQGDLIKENPIITNMFGLNYVTDPSKNYLKALHCEFEGGGIKQLLDSAYVLLAALLAALFVPYPFNYILFILVLIIALLDIRLALTGDTPAEGSGDPLDVNPDLGELRPGDILVMQGEWIYDSLHPGKNEIHPVRHCQRIARRNNEDDTWANDQNIKLDTPEDVIAEMNKWCGILKDTKDANDNGSKDDPKNDWVIHPLIDGCKDPIILL